MHNTGVSCHFFCKLIVGKNEIIVKLISRISLLLLLVPLKIFSQDFTGIWTGYIYTSGTQLPYELVISENNDQLTGYSLSVFSINGVENTGMKRMKIRDRKGSLMIEDDEMIYNNYTTLGKRVTLYSTLSLKNEDSALVLQGPFFTRSVDRTSFKGNIRLQKKKSTEETRMISQLKRLNIWNNLSFIRNAPAGKESETTTAIVKTGEKPATDSVIAKEEMIASTKTVNKADAVSLPGQKKEIPSSTTPTIANAKPSVMPVKIAAAEINLRKTEVIRTISFQSDSLVLSLYDNGEVDGDTVSVVVNDKVIIARKGLTTAATTATIYITAESGDSLRLIMYAENLGRIPPNTGLLIIQDGEERQQVRFEGDLQKNSAVILRRKR